LPNRITVLLVEDNDNLLQFMQNALNDEFDVAVASDGEIAWSYITKNIPDLVVSDIMMPNMDGFELCRLIKSTYRTSHIPVVLLTALSEKPINCMGLALEPTIT
jgi:CheY-like chemotaxis protein